MSELQAKITCKDVLAILQSLIVFMTQHLKNTSNEM